MTGDPAPAGFRAALRPLLALYALDVLTAFTVGMVPPLLPLLAREWALSPVEAGLVNTAYAVGRLAGSAPASRLRARRGTRAAIFAGVALLIAGVVACGLAPGFPAFLIGRGLMGLGASAAFLAVFAELLESADPAWRGRLANAFEAMAILSLAVGGVLAAWLESAVGWRGVFLGAGPVLLTTLGAWRALGPDAGRHVQSGAVARWSETGAEVRALGPIYAASFAMTLTWSGLFTTMVPLVGAGNYGLSAAAIGTALGAGYVAELVGLLAVGVVIDRVRREPLFLGGALAVALGGLGLAVGGTPAAFVGGLVLIGGGYAVWMIPATVLTDRLGTPLPPGHLAVYRIVMDVGMIAGPLLVGTLARLASDRVAVGGAGLILVAGALALLRR